jgi:glutathione S-transferase
MKLYDSTIAPNPRRVRMFLAEKNLEVPLVPIDITQKENRQAPFLEKNPIGKLPVLELDDGTYIAESGAICEYLEELQPKPALHGETPEERVVIRMWDRRIELEVMTPLLDGFRHTTPFFEGRIEQSEEYAEICRRTVTKRLAWLDECLGRSDYVAGPAFSVADITLFCALEFGEFVGECYEEAKLPGIAAWRERVAARPSAAN